MVNVRPDDHGQLLVFALVPLILIVVGVAMIIVGISTAGSGAVGLGLMWVGGGIVVGDFGGFVVVKHPSVLIGGGAGFVILLIGAALRAFVGR